MKNRISKKDPWKPNAKRVRAFVGGNENYFRAIWEFYVALYLEYLKQSGEIQYWGYETKSYTFDVPTSNKSKMYMPDFLVKLNDNTEALIEVKGKNDPKSRAHLDNMSKQYPRTKIHLWREQEIMSIKLFINSLMPIIPLVWKSGKNQLLSNADVSVLKKDIMLDGLLSFDSAKIRYLLDSHFKKMLYANSTRYFLFANGITGQQKEATLRDVMGMRVKDRKFQWFLKGSAL